ncbi:MAG: hypothetical protein ABR538_16390 [Candidatus Binatia bacterium]
MNARPLARWVELVSSAFAALGLFLPLAFQSPFFAAYRGALAEWAYAAPFVPAADGELLHLMLGILGGSIAGKWIVHAMIARGPLAEGKAWARRLTLAGLPVWFAIDSGYGLAHRGLFNVAMVNVPAILVTLPPWLVLAAQRHRERD